MFYICATAFISGKSPFLDANAMRIIYGKNYILSIKIFKNGYTSNVIYNKLN